MPDRDRSILTATDARRWLLNVRSGLRRAAPALDAVNVFPVADGDTGTNMFLTVDTGLRTAPAWDADDVHGSIDGLARAVLWAARGNSGVILAQLVAGAAQEVVKGAAGDRAGGLDAAGLARALGRADALAWQAVASPAGGTILSVSRAAASAARRAADAGSSLEEVARAAFDAAHVALARTPDELTALRDAHVVDAGAAGYVVTLRHLVVTCGGPVPEAPALLWLTEAGAELPDLPTPKPQGAAPAGDGAGSSGVPEPEAVGEPTATDSDSTLEVVLSTTLPEQAARRADRVIRRLRRKLGDLGDSVVVAGAGRHWRVHVHVRDARTASKVTALCRRLGEVADVRTESLDGVHDARREVALLAAASGEGLSNVLRAAGARVVESSPGRRTGIGDLVGAVEACGATRVVFLPGDDQLLLPAQEAARHVAQRGIWMQVVDSRSLQGTVAAVAVWDPVDDVDKSVRAMVGAASSTHDGAVRALPGGDLVGVVGGQQVTRAATVEEALPAVIAALPTRGVELATVVLGEGVDASVGRLVEASLRLRRRSLEVQVIEGGPAVLPVLVGLE
ncbi:DAK2 domain-containing protein [Kytococcus sp. Marseille-QA3725]